MKPGDFTLSAGRTTQRPRSALRSGRRSSTNVTQPSSSGLGTTERVDVGGGLETALSADASASATTADAIVPDA
jgi:hypothetical protein